LNSAPMIIMVAERYSHSSSTMMAPMEP